LDTILSDATTEMVERSTHEKCSLKEAAFKIALERLA